jgi:hypothetical protein
MVEHMQKKNHMIISRDTAKVLDEIQHLLIKKDPERLEIEWSYLKLLNLMFVYREDKPIANCIPNKKK